MCRLFSSNRQAVTKDSPCPDSLLPDSSHLQHSMSGGEESKDRLQQTLHLIRMPSLAQLRHADDDPESIRP